MPLVCDATREGSSPHTRGAQDTAITDQRSARIIPAYAGSTSTDSGPFHDVRDHPRIRGEHRREGFVARQGAGSSPHTRGARHHHRHRVSALGIIPAYAGSTGKRRGSSLGSSDHPRIRGEHSVLFSGRSRRPGIIPAYAGSTPPSISAWELLWDHPRIRGEHVQEGLARRREGGSSPHTRGAHLEVVVYPVQLGIIPAYAGSTGVWRTRPAFLADHPRIRGEHAKTIPVTIRHFGSSPHTRGAPTPLNFCTTKTRIIPAYAGSTERGVQVIEQTPDHPRIRGEHGYQLGEDPVPGGSSPHTRGALPAPGGAGTGFRIIPAYAGSTSRSSGRSSRAGDHPRIRGEHIAGINARMQDTRIIPAYAGSTATVPQIRFGNRDHPRIRGEHPRGRTSIWPDARIIPAYAGSTRRRQRRSSRRADHPRIRGEHDLGADYMVRNSGSSPHTRGALESVCGHVDVPGIIPAYAGSTRSGGGARGSRRDHPRIRGEHCQAILHVSSLAGSSPHTRGAHRRPHRPRHRRRIIPAYAGSTSLARGGFGRPADHPRIRGEHRLDIPWPQAMQGSSPHTRGARARSPT